MARSFTHAAGLVLALASFAAATVDAAPVSVPDDPLRGPDVPDIRARSLVSRTMTGRFVPVQGRPEVEAIRSLGLPRETRDAALAIVHERSRRLAIHVFEQLDLTSEMFRLRGLRLYREAGRLQTAVWDGFENPNDRESTSRDPIVPLLEGTLSTEQLADMTRLLDEYWEARIDWQLRSRNEADQTSPRVRRNTQRSLLRTIALGEIRTARDRTLSSYRGLLGDIDEYVRPSRRQRGQIRSLVLDSARTNNCEAGPAERLDLHEQIYELLDTEQREAMFKMVVSQQLGQ